ncbi:MAG TPA: hypothetical protein VFZ65_07465 [Planctomycetota bacterium]|nr:hypothetical protein [Planctomycetota bacterium]
MQTRARLLAGLASATVTLALEPSLAAQDALRAWGSVRFATDAYSLPALDVAASTTGAAVVRSDGRVFVHGSTLLPDAPPAPAGTSYTRLVMGGNDYSTAFGFGLLSDGSILAWGYGGSGLPAPALPANTTYVDVSAGYDHAVALRSDGVAVAWGGNLVGQTTLPAVPPGVTVLQVHAGYQHSLLRLSNGTIVGSGIALQTAVPALPVGLTYTDLWAGTSHAIARRSDGVYVSWGNNTYGQGPALPLPAGVSYTTMGLGTRHTVAARSDGVVVAWGDDSYGQGDVPALPAGAVVAQIVGGHYHTTIRFTNGLVIGFGGTSYLAFTAPLSMLPAGERWAGAAAGAPMLGLTSAGAVVILGQDPSAVPALPAGLSYVDVIGGTGHSVVLRSDGRALAWGDNSHGQCAIPPLPPGMTYTAGSAAWARTVLLRSDGQAVECGNQGAVTIPAPPPGVRYVDVACQTNGTTLLRSDGAVTVVNSGTGPPAAPPLPAGVRYTKVARAGSCCAALRSDGGIEVWGTTLGAPFPPLPSGVSYVELDGGEQVLVARRSDGTVVGAAQNTNSTILEAPSAQPGESFVEVSAGAYEFGLARVGPTCTYVSFATGCAGTRPASRLVPRDTPRLGAPLEVTVFDLPQDLAIVVWGWQRVGPIPLAAIGMPGCAQQISIDATELLSGQGGQAKFTLPIPNALSLVGVSFHNQAIVFDAAANAAGLVVSDAAEGVIGHR